MSSTKYKWQLAKCTSMESYETGRVAWVRIEPKEYNRYTTNVISAYSHHCHQFVYADWTELMSVLAEDVPFVTIAEYDSMTNEEIIALGKGRSDQN